MVVSDEKPRFEHKVVGDWNPEGWRDKWDGHGCFMYETLRAGGFLLDVSGAMEMRLQAAPPYAMDQMRLRVATGDSKEVSVAIDAGKGDADKMRAAALAQLADDLMDLAEAAREVWGSAR